MLRIQKSLSILLFMESKRMFFIQQYLNHLKNFAILDRFIKKKTRRKHDENQDRTILLEIKAGGKLFETRMATTDFIEHSA